MKLIIDIPETDYNAIRDNIKAYSLADMLFGAVKDGTPIKDGDLISRSILKEEFLKYKPYAVDFLSLIDNAPTVEPNNEYGAIQYSNGFNDGFTTAKDTIIQNIAKQYSAHNELVPEWLHIGD